ncbi:MAG: prolipoprotein diacylglyceryl transferase [Deltaproteobacteria bacterium]|nr:prolipoprotein diacylglyceryl transferase [Deltaproteobacteria bacterium]MBW2053432.1 prolipoprotein diacylglyceryl transferase [Deltaproteobacteria bacterium]MBW2142132.1 prolipoprotein diacylglyceryl transferase [Deltaproteobacteria bacterium]MBW2323738.1 prolipoprotein diacylglyceryl transferase [Deltaproteobacteria bacterium]
MFPVLLELGPLTVSSYGVLAALGFLLALIWVVYDAKKDGLNSDTIADLAFYLALGGVIGSRIFFLIISWDYYRNNILDILKFWEGGLVFYGGLITAVFIFIIYTLVKSLPLWKAADIFAPGIALAQGVGRLGCLAAGCCYGKPSNLPWAITFTHPNSLASPLGEALHPTQLYAALSLFVLFLFLVLLKRRRVFAGQIFLSYTLLHALIRFVIEFFRGDFRGAGPFGILTSTQTVALLIVIISPIMMIYLYRHRQSG